MTDPLTPDERMYVDSLSYLDVGIDRGSYNMRKKFVAIIDRLAPKPQPPQPRVLWAVYSADGCKLCTSDCETTAGLIANRRGARVVKMVEATP